MEDGPDGRSSEPSLPEPMKNGEVMAKLDEEDTKDDIDSSLKINGNATLEEPKSDDSDSSDYDALVIDESASSKNELRKPKSGFKGFKNTNNEELDNYMHSNPYFAESIFELFEKSQEKKVGEVIEEKKPTGCKNHRHIEKKGKANPKLREYAQYLGLQPTVQFKCSKCARAGFPSLASLNYHILRCNETAPANGAQHAASSGPPSTNFRVTRKVFLCSACGTYYENWNLFLHMREVHKRYICLYCLGMFSHPEKLSLHIVSKHNCVPNRINTLEEFYDAHKEPCFLMCCECQKGFTETDNFFEHQCVEANPKTPLKTVSVKQNNQKNLNKVEHVTADSNVQQSPQKDEENAAEQTPNDEVQCKEEVEEQEEVVEKDCENTDDRQEMSPVGETMETTQQEDITCDSNLTQTEEDSQPAIFDDAPDERMQDDDEAVSFRGSCSEDSFVASPERPVENVSEGGGVEETRKVPKVTLKFKDFEYRREEALGGKAEDDGNCESDDSEKLTMEVDRIEDESREEEAHADDEEEKEKTESGVTGETQTMQVAGPDVPIVELELEQPLDKFEVKPLLQKCLRTTIATCVYCNHARRISVNGKQLALHAIAEHRFSAVVNSITAEELIPESFVARITDGLSDLENVYFNLEEPDETTTISFSHVFECFQCRYSTTVHKELYLHNRKMHAKSILLCIMCKSNFYSYSELICHLCPGLYDLERDVRFRCCMCVGDELPSAFRLMVHLRKRHNACDVCLEPCHNQAKLSNHVWKHKLHHLCYRCGIAYRNKPDITKHLFWKHGTESVLCKKCLQKKWPHVYHFCILPPSFICEECNLSFSKAVYLMVHKRLHVNERPHVCSEEDCGERFVSKKLLLKHEFKHREPTEELRPEPENPPEVEAPVEAPETSSQPSESAIPENDAESEKNGDKPKAKVDVYDLPELNLSESDSSDSGDEAAPNSVENECPEGEAKPEKPILETIWDDFRNYRPNEEIETNSVNLEAIMGDHDYCVVLEKPEGKEASGDLQPDHDYCFGTKGEIAKEDGAKSSSDSSSDSDSSSCTCGSNCSCSSSSGNNSSSSDGSSSDSSSSEGRRRQQARRERRKQKTKTKKKAGANEKAPADIITNTDGQSTLTAAATAVAPPVQEAPIRESDLETTESDTDEDFYDEQPQKLANKLLAEKKNQLLQMAAIGPYINGSIMDGSRPPTPGLPPTQQKKKKSKSKKRKKKNKSSKYEAENHIPVLPSNSPIGELLASKVSAESQAEIDMNLRASKRRRVPNKFYGYSSDEEREKAQPLKWRKVDLPSTPRSPLVVPPITIKTTMAEPFRATTPAEFRHRIKPLRPPPQPPMPPPQMDSNESSSEEEIMVPRPPAPPPASSSTQQPQLYCYCRCPYDEVSEMIGCDSNDCAIEWFHFECVGIMVPPKGQWFCPDCRKKKQQRRELLHGHPI